MALKNETRWLCENSKALEQYSGQWVMFSVNEGVVGKGESLKKVLEDAKKLNIHPRPYVFLVPSKEELGSPVALLPKK